MYTATTLAEWVGTTPQTINKWVREGVLPCAELNTGGRKPALRRFLPEHVATFLQNHTPEAQWEALPRSMQTDPSRLGSLYTVQQVSDQLQVTRATVYSYMKEGRLGFLIVGDARRISEHHIATMFANNY